jgi:hypothetical protein
MDLQQAHRDTAFRAGRAHEKAEQEELIKTLLSEIERLKQQVSKRPCVVEGPDKTLGIEQRLESISLARLLLGEPGNITAAALATMSSGQIFRLISGPVVTAIATAVDQAVNPSQPLVHCGALVSASVESQSTSRGKFRQTLQDLIGPVDATKRWQDEYVEAMDAGMLKAGQTFAKDFPHHATLDQLTAWADEQGKTQNAMACGYTEEEAHVIQCIKAAPVASELGAALVEGSPRYTALTHASYCALARLAIQHHGNRLPGPRGAFRSHGVGDKDDRVAPSCYHFITDKKHQCGLGDKDPRWLSIETPDETAFRGLTTYVPLVMKKADAALYSPVCLRDTLNGEYHDIDSDLVCFESASPEQGGWNLHSAVPTGGLAYMLPPLTLLTVVNVQEAGDWEYLPGKKINQRLITVRPTYVTPVELVIGPSTHGNKFATNRTFLTYGNSGAE